MKVLTPIPCLGRFLFVEFGSACTLKIPHSGSPQTSPECLSGWQEQWECFHLSPLWYLGIWDFPLPDEIQNTAVSSAWSDNKKMYNPTKYCCCSGRGVQRDTDTAGTQTWSSSLSGTALSSPKTNPMKLPNWNRKLFYCPSSLWQTALFNEKDLLSHLGGKY